MLYPACRIDLDMSGAIAKLPKHRGYTTLPPRTVTEYVTLHYSGINYTDRSHDAEIKRILSEATYQLDHNYGVSGGTAYPDGYLYDLVVLSDGTVVQTRAAPVQLWHCGNATGNARSYAVHLMLGPSQDATNAQWSAVVAAFMQLRAAYRIPVTNVVGHNEWPRTRGLPHISPAYIVTPPQSECPGALLHARLADYRATHAPMPEPPTPPTAAYTADAPILGVGHATLQQAQRYVAARPHPNMTPDDLALYWDVCKVVGVDPVLAVAQMVHEGALTSAWGSQHNPAGIGAVGTPGVGLTFPDWETGIRAQVGRLLAYALAPGERTLTQQALITEALHWRPLPPSCQGSAPILRFLGEDPNPVPLCGWASPGSVYGAQIAEIATAIVHTP